VDARLTHVLVDLETLSKRTVDDGMRAQLAAWSTPASETEAAKANPADAARPG
jgi:hypothetical protein